MKSQKKSSLSDLHVDVAEYMFVEWLVRHDLYAVYKANCERFRTDHRTFREELRTRIRSLLQTPRLTLGSIISCSFPFLLTSEGYKFWLNQSVLWRNFCETFDSNL